MPKVSARCGGCLLLVSLGVAAAPCMAADAGGNPKDSPENDALVEIVVTAERRSVDLQKSSLAISVYESDELTKANFGQARDLTLLDPGIQVGQGGPVTQIYIRGVGDFGTTALTNPAVATNIDGVYIARETGIEGNFYDLQRVEVLKGPQGTLYGRNSSGGAVNIITNPPALDAFDGHVEVEGGNYSDVRSEGYVNLPVGGEIAVRGSYEVVSRAGYDSEGYDDDHHQSGRLSALWKPNEDFSLRVTGDVEHIGGTGPGYVIKGPDPSASLADAIYSYGGSALPSNPRVTLIDPPIQQYLNAASNVLGLPCLPIGAPLAATAAGPAPLTTGNQQFCPAGTFNLFSSRYESNFFEDNLFTNMRAEANWNLGSATLTVLPSFRQVKDSYVVLPLVPFKDKDSSYASSLEIRLGNAAGPIIWTVGAFLFHEDQHIQAGYDGVSRWDLLGDSFYLDHLTEGSQALFGQVTVSVAPDWRVIGGLRQTRDRKTIDGTYQVTTHIIGIDFAGPNVLYPGAPPGECFGQGSATMNCIADRYAGDRVWNFTSYKTGIEHDLTERNMLYFTFAVGQKSGGFNDESVQPGQAATFNPETVKAFELGARNRFLNDTLQVNPEAFFWRYDAAQQYISVQTPEGGNISALANVGLAESYGLDLDLRWRFTSADMLHVGTEYLHSRFERFTFTNSNEPTFATSCTITPLSGAGPNESIDCAGKPLTHAPEYSGSASWTHVFTFRNSATLDATLSGRFASSRELTIDYSPQSRAPAYSEGDFNLAYTSAGRKWRVAAFIHNFNNALVYTGGFSVPSSLPGVFAANLAAPRTFGARASVDF